MARRKRPYVPKIKGCYECSQRRIDCDRTEPSCNKCSSRGLSCSGFGVKYRFRNGFVPGRRTPKRSRSSNSYASTTLQASPASTSDSDHSWSTRSGISDGHTSRGSILTDGSYGCFHLGMSESPAPPGGCASGVNISHQGSQNGTAPLNDRSDLVFEAIEQDPLLGFVHGDEPCDAFFAHGGSGYEASPECNSQGVFDVIAEYTSLLGSEEAESQALSSDESSLSYDECMAESPITPNSDWCEDIAPGCQVDLVDSSSKRLLLKHFSDKIAPEMVVIDGEYNGWRHLVLPIALTDDLVMSAVLAASAFHLSGSVGSEVEAVADPGKLYAQAIQKLQQRRELNGCDAKTRQMVILAIVVLLVAVMINGCSDFPVMFRMLQSALDAIGGESGLIDGGEVAEFSLRQIRKMRVYAAPLLSQDDGLHAIMSHANQSFDCLHYYRRLYPQYSSVFDILADLRQQAFDIYLKRVLGPGDTKKESSTANIEKFIKTLESFPQGSPGEHVLIWSCFIAASESREPAHKLFFQHFLSKQYSRNGFANILIALDLLQKIWARSSNADWPALLPEPQVFIM